MSENTVQILVVDDNPATLYSTCRVLQTTGWKVLEAKCGAEAVEMVKQGIDLVVLDVNLPDFDGFEVCRRIRSMPETREFQWCIYQPRSSKTPTKLKVWKRAGRLSDPPRGAASTYRDR